jgi:hypothetical protein
LTAATTPATSTNATTAATFSGVVLILINIVRVSVRRRYTRSTVDDSVLDGALAYARTGAPRKIALLTNSSEDAYPYTSVMAVEDTVLEEAMDNLKEAGQRIRATQSLMRSQGMTDGENYRDLLTRLSTALAMTEAAYLEARRRRDH